MVLALVWEGSMKKRLIMMIKLILDYFHWRGMGSNPHWTRKCKLFLQLINIASTREMTREHPFLRLLDTFVAPVPAPDPPALDRNPQMYLSHPSHHSALGCVIYSTILTQSPKWLHGNLGADRHKRHLDSSSPDVILDGEVIGASGRGVGVLGLAIPQLVP